MRFWKRCFLEGGGPRSALSARPVHQSFRGAVHEPDIWMLIGSSGHPLTTTISLQTSSIMFALRRNLLRFPRATPLRSIRSESTYQAPQPPAPKKSPHGTFYKEFSRPVVKNFLVAVLTYQILYFTWSKLESLEIKNEKETEMKALEGELRSLTSGQSTS